MQKKVLEKTGNAVGEREKREKTTERH